MGCCGGGAGEDDDGAVDDSTRRCRDVLWTLLFIAFWAGSVSCASLGFKNGDPGVLLYGLDYDGNVCNSDTGSADLRGLRDHYFLDPNEVISARAAGFSLADANSICLGSCPTLLPNNSLSWVCKYPTDSSGANVDAKLVPSIAAWQARNYDYFKLLNASAKASSCALRGPCYPVVTMQNSFFFSCAYSTLNNVPVSASAIATLQQCQSCCSNATQKACVFPVVDALPASYNPKSPSQAAACMAGCETLHGSYSDIESTTTSSVSATAVGLFQLTCKAAGAPSMAIPLPGAADRGAAAAVVAALVNSEQSLMARYVSDLVTAYRPIIVCGLVLPFIFSFLWLAVLRFFAPSLVVLTIVGVNVATLGATLYCFEAAGKLNVSAGLSYVQSSVQQRLDQDPALASAVASLAAAANATASAVGSAVADASAAAASAAASLNVTVSVNVSSVLAAGGVNSSALITPSSLDTAAVSKQHMLYLGIAAAVCTGLLWLYTLSIARRLRIAVAALGVSCDALGKAPQLVLQPLVGLLATAVFLVWWLVVALYLASSTTITRRDCCASVQAAWGALFPPAEVGNSTLYALPSCAVIHCGFDMALDAGVAGTMVYHMFAFLWNTQLITGFGVCIVSHVTYRYYVALGKGEAMPPRPVMRATGVATWFYTGSIAFGAFLCAWVQFVRLPLMLVARHLRGVEQRGKLQGAALAAAVFTQRLLTLLVKLVGAHAYAMVVVTGRAYCDAGVEALAALEQNMHVAETVTEVAVVVLLLAKVMVGACCSFWCFIWLDALPAGTVSSPLLPVLVVFVASFSISCLFFAVPELTMETVLLAFCVDCATNGGQPRFSPPALTAAVECHNSLEALSCCGCTGPPKADGEGDNGGAKV